MARRNDGAGDARLHTLKKENGRLKKLLAEQVFDNLLSVRPVSSWSGAKTQLKCWLSWTRDGEDGVNEHRDCKSCRSID